LIDASSIKRLGPLAEREFRLLFLGRAVSFLGNAMAPIALAFAVLQLTGSKSDLGFVLAARSAPQMVFLLIGGIWADRLPRNQVMLASSVLSGASQGTLAALLLSGHAQLWHLLAISAVNGTSSAFFFPASAGIVPQTVPPVMIQQANALVRLAVNSSLVIGAAAGGGLVAAAGPGWAIAVDAATFGAGALFVGAMRLPAVAQEEAANFLRELGEGWRAFRSRTWLWAIVLQFSLVNAASSGTFQVLGPVQAKAHFGGAGAWGAILACESAGLIVGGLSMLRFRPARLLLVGTFAVLLLALPVALLGPPAPAVAVAAAAFLMGVGIEVFVVCWDTTMQQQIPGPMLSRVYSYDALGSIALVPVGLAIAGPLADALGTRATLYGAAALVVAATLPVFAVRDVRELRRK
jgi:MFS family permease